MILLDQFAVDTYELFFRQCRKEVPAEVERLLNRPVLVQALPDEPVLEEVGELKEHPVALRERVFPDDGDEAPEIVTFRICRVELVRDLLVVFAGVTLADTEVHHATATAAR